MDYDLMAPVDKEAYYDCVTVSIDVKCGGYGHWHQTQQLDGMFVRQALEGSEFHIFGIKDQLWRSFEEMMKK
jgi:hypothetical protein